MSATLRITRESALILRVRKLNVLLNCAFLGQVGNNQTMEFQIPPGRHTLEIKLGSQSSPERRFIIQEGEAAEFVCSTAVDGASFGDKLSNLFNYRKRPENIKLRAL